MGLDYYYLLDVNADATLEELHKAWAFIYWNDILYSYRRLALKFHPLRNKDESKEKYQKFLWVSEAYEVLKDPELRARYDQFGECGLKNGIPGRNNPVKYLYHGDPYRTFQDYFGGTNPFKGRPFYNIFWV